MSASVGGNRLRGRWAWLGQKRELGRGALAGCRRSWAGKEKERGGKRKKGFQFSKSTQANEFKPRFEFKHSKQCTSMYATVNSYISLIN
jgi:hypothetical protein